MIFKKRTINDIFRLNASSVCIITSPTRLLDDNPGIVEGAVIQVSTDVITDIVHSGNRPLRTVVTGPDFVVMEKYMVQWIAKPARQLYNIAQIMSVISLQINSLHRIVIRVKDEKA
jgi:hypothetical protein